MSKKLSSVQMKIMEITKSFGYMNRCLFYIFIHMI